MNIKRRSYQYGKVLDMLLACERPSTDDLVSVLKEDGVSLPVIEYIADLHRQKVDGFKSLPASTAKRSQQFINTVSAINDEYARARRSGETISKTTAIERASKRIGISASSMRRYLKT